MLQIKNISKTYKTKYLVQNALNNVSLSLRNNEFVAILGPSGSGKTTLLNIIGGLDTYDTGDLIINGISTKKYKDRDWDTYRNHTIGFVFQSYNLIPHQTVLSNVELALTIGGISRKERKRRALEALDEVGLKDQAHKKPNQMSGGQMQRVAIARALVNNPDIVLADEPTGALDTKTSVQVMNLLQKVANDRLVVMVTHNPELAQEYANRIIKLKDGVILSDSNPLVINEDTTKKKIKRTKKAHMSIFTALALSFNNLLTKKGRTILTAFAGSIGIIGIALILSLSQGFQNYIDKIQEDTLSSYPLTITSETADTTSAILSMVTDRKENVAEGENIVERQYLTTMFSSIGSNDLKSFKKYIEDNQSEVDKNVNNIRYSYSITPQIYTIDVSDTLAKLNPSSILSSMYSSSSLSMLSSMSSGGGGIFSEMTDDIDSLIDQYDVLKGRWPQNYDELIIVLSEPNSISDLLVYSLGLRETAELKTIITDVMTGEEVSVENEPLKLTYDDLMNLDLKLIKATDRYKYNEKYDIYEDMSDDDEYMRDVYDKSLKLKVVGLVCAKEDSSSTSLSAGVSYTKALTQYVIDEAHNTAIVQSQIRNKDVDVFSGKRFDEEKDEDDEKSQLDFEDMISIDEDMLKDAFKINVDEDSFDFDQDELQNSIVTYTTNMISSLTTDIEPAKNDFETTLKILCKNYLDEYIETYKSLDNIEFIDADNNVFITTFTTSSQKFLEPIKTLKNSYKVTSTVPDVLTPTYTSIVPGVFEAAKLAFPSSTPITSIDTTALADAYFLSLQSMIIPSTPTYAEMVAQIASAMTTYKMINAITVNVTSLTTACLKPLASLGDLFGEDMMEIDTDKFAEAFKFDMDQDELSRIMETMMSGTQEKTYKNNLISLGYQDEDDPTNISFYFKDFTSKENFISLIDKYNENLDDDHKLRYTDITGLLMSSVKTIVDSVTYVLIAFVSISLIVSSIMIAVITLISVMERTKEIGILRAMGASKKNVSSIFNAETFIIGLLSGLLGVGFTIAVIPFINNLIHSLTDNYDINAVLPTQYAVILVLISVFLTIIAGVIPSRKASKQDPVIALRTE